MKPIDPQSYYSFRDAEKEIEFHRHDTPTPWMNYLSNGTFHTMLSHAGGGVGVLQIAADLADYALPVFSPADGPFGTLHLRPGRGFGDVLVPHQ
ncbi:hypothetical protein HMSSN139_12920 [Paenibacillus sp. HMSSN-139]|nr:hypothetical protein HMSSN139_12920 [Paenibacillus sp. HMSSN-139]